MFLIIQGGSIIIVVDGSFVYILLVGFMGDDIFEYFIVDDGLLIVIDLVIFIIMVYLVVRLNYIFVNDDLYYIEFEIVVNEDVFLNDIDFEGDN